jgi:serine/threonine protein phosphatase 1
MEMPNAVCLVGNHEVMALECLKFMQKEITDETIEELDIKTWENILTWQNNGGKTYFPDKYVVTGHTPTQMIEQNPKPGFIYRKNNHIAIDCGANFPDGRLAAICLDTGEEYYI